jgi:putative hydrolase of the HAD superfamily
MTTGRAVVFDLGAVLFQWQPEKLLQETLPELAPDADAAKRLCSEIFQSFTVGGDWARFDQGLISEQDLAINIAARLRAKHWPQASPHHVQHLVDAIPEHLQAVEPVVELFYRLKAEGHRLFYLSNMPLRFAAHLEARHAFLGECSDGIYSSRVQRVKPQPEIFELARQRFQLTPAHTLFIDDSAKNIDAARAVGWQTILFTDAQRCEVDLLKNRWLSSGDQAG